MRHKPAEALCLIIAKGGVEFPHSALRDRESAMLETRQPASVRMFPGRQTTDFKRKLIEFAPEVWLALDLLAKDTGRSVQDLADEAFGDLLGKYQRPASLKDALRESARRLPANDDVPPLG